MKNPIYDIIITKDEYFIKDGYLLSLNLYINNDIQVFKCNLVKLCLGLDKIPQFILDYNEFIINIHQLNRVPGIYIVYNPYYKKIYVGSSQNLYRRVSKYFYQLSIVRTRQARGRL